MSKAVLISIQPKWCGLIANGQKTVEVRKNRPKLETPFKCYIYCTMGKTKDPRELLEIHGSDGKIRKTNGMVMGEFVCDKLSYIEANVDVFGEQHLYNTTFLEHRMCLTDEELFRYLFRGKDFKSNGGWGWHIRNLVIYNKPKELSEFVVKGDCDCMNCRKCSWFDAGNGYNLEDDCNLVYENINRKEPLKPLFRPPQSWCYVEELRGGADHA